MIITGRPHQDGASNTLAGSFAKGATDAGRSVKIPDIAHMKTGFCKGSYQGMNRHDCIIKDDFTQVERERESSKINKLIKTI